MNLTTMRSVRVAALSLLAAFGGTVLYSAFTMLTGLEASLLGIPVGLAMGQAVYYISERHGGWRYQMLAVALAFVAFDLTYAPGMAGIAFKKSATLLTFLFFVFMTSVSPVIDPANGAIGLFMVAAGMYLAWTMARLRTQA